MSAEKLRIDKYLWAIRVFKTRSQAQAAIEAGKVKYNGDAVKASKLVGIGEQYRIKTPARDWIIEVTGLLHNRVQFTEAINYYVDLTPKEDEAAKVHKVVFVENTGKRQSKQGRPTKRNRRQMGDMLDL